MGYHIYAFDATCLRSSIRAGMKEFLLLFVCCFVVYANASNSKCSKDVFTKISCDKLKGLKYSIITGAPGPQGPSGSSSPAGKVTCQDRLSQFDTKLAEVTKLVDGVVAKSSVANCQTKCKTREYTYRLFHLKRNYAEARLFCKLYGGDLAHKGAKTAAQRRVIVQRLGGNVDSKYWFGIDDGMKEGSWKWVDGNQVDKAEVGFASGQPNVGVKENCGATNGNMLLHDYP